ncbi:hypothetical protein CT113_13265 [Levilactobacillus brevis]|nr:hypothetical protein CT113_13265 [Levilactobacillus brevis]
MWLAFTMVKRYLTVLFMQATTATLSFWGWGLFCVSEYLVSKCALKSRYSPFDALIFIKKDASLID